MENEMKLEDFKQNDIVVFKAAGSCKQEWGVVRRTDVTANHEWVIVRCDGYELGVLIREIVFHRSRGY